MLKAESHGLNSKYLPVSHPGGQFFSNKVNVDLLKCFAKTSIEKEKLSKINERN